MSAKVHQNMSFLSERLLMEFALGGAVSGRGVGGFLQHPACSCASATATWRGGECTQNINLTHENPKRQEEGGVFEWCGMTKKMEWEEGGKGKEGIECETLERKQCSACCKYSMNEKE
eukprot:scaffold3873_cov177-Ochromonas_danica.AAC.7